MNVPDIEGYRSFLAERNGEADLLNRRLANREKFFAGIEASPIHSRRRFDPDAIELEMGTCDERHPACPAVGAFWRPGEECPQGARSAAGTYGAA